MTAPWKWTLACAVAALVLLSAPAASAQVAAQPDSHRGHQEMMARMMEMDVRIEMLAADMNALVGAQKVAAMATLLTAMVERQALMRDAMMLMHEQMKCSMTKPEAAAPHP